MSDYSRFISYIYEYIDRKKSANRGFVKIESRQGISHLQFQVNVYSLPAQTPVEVYAYIFVNGTPTAHRLGELHATSQGFHECLIYEHAQFPKTYYKLRQYQGLLLREPRSGRFFATQWDDAAIDPWIFPYDQASVRSDSTSENSISSGVNMFSAKSFSSNPDVTVEKDVDSDFKVSAKEKNASFSYVPSKKNTPSSDSGPMPSDSSNSGPMPFDSSNSGPMPSASSDSGSKDSDSSDSDSVESASVRMANLWKQLSDTFPHVYPFTSDRQTSGKDPEGFDLKEKETADVAIQSDDSHSAGKLKDCLMIKMQDFPALREMGWQISCNRFMCVGFHQFHHLLLGCRPTAQGMQCLLGVPGTCSEQEQFFAGLYGFGEFIPGNIGQARRKRGGYWCRPLSHSCLSCSQVSQESKSSK